MCQARIKHINQLESGDGRIAGEGSWHSRLDKEHLWNITFLKRRIELYQSGNIQGHGKVEFIITFLSVFCKSWS